MSFSKLLNELDEFQLAKSAPADGAESGDNNDADIRAAAEEGAAAGERDDLDDLDDDGEGGEGGGEGETFGKSLTVTTEDGETIDAIDGTEMLKALNGRVDALEGALGTDSEMFKAVNGLFSLVKSQEVTIDALRADVARLSSSGRGRRAIVTMPERQEETLAKSERTEGVSSDEFMAKALNAQAQGRITALDVSRAEGFLAKGLQLPADLVGRVLG